MSIKAMVDEHIRKQIRTERPDDPAGWTRRELINEVKRLRAQLRSSAA